MLSNNNNTNIHNNNNSLCFSIQFSLTWTWNPTLDESAINHFINQSNQRDWTLKNVFFFPYNIEVINQSVKKALYCTQEHDNARSRETVQRTRKRTKSTNREAGMAVTWWGGPSPQLASPSQLSQQHRTGSREEEEEVQEEEEESASKLHDLRRDRWIESSQMQ